MTRSIIRIGIPFIGSAVVALAMFACSSDDSGGKGGGDTDASAGGASGGKGGTAASAGGKSSSGGSTSAGGSGAGGAPTGDLYSCFARQGKPLDGGVPNEGGTAAAGAACCNDFGTCKKSTDLESDPASPSYGHSDCKAADGLVCAPKDLNDLPDGGTLPPCHAKYGSLNLEGRCLPKCFTEGNALASQITEGDCPKIPSYGTIVCAPCFNPVDGTSTGACNRPLAEGGTDKPVEAKAQFKECGAVGDGGPKTGLCVPKDLVGQVADPKLVPPDTCADGELCAPTKKVKDQTSCFKKCTAMVGGDGACTPTYIVDFVKPGVSSVLGKVDCDDGETCTPCLDPTAGNAPTGACDN